MHRRSKASHRHRIKINLEFTIKIALCCVNEGEFDLDRKPFRMGNLQTVLAADIVKFNSGVDNLPIQSARRFRYSDLHEDY